MFGRFNKSGSRFYAGIAFLALVLIAMRQSLTLLHHRDHVLVAQRESKHHLKGPRIPENVDFYVRTWKGDGHWLIFMLRSIEAHVPRHVYRNIIITYEKTEDAFFRSYLPRIPLPIVLIPEDNVYIRDGPNNGSYYSQMYSKFFPWKLSDADYFIHFDSDCVFTTPVSRADFVDDLGRVPIQATNYSDLGKEFQVWRAPAEALLKEAFPAETMTGFPFVYPRELYVQFIAHIERIHQKPFIEVLKSMPNFNEFTPLGHFLINHMPGRWYYSTTKSKKVRQQFSWGGFTPEAAAACEIAIRSVHGTR